MFLSAPGVCVAFFFALLRNLRNLRAKKPCHPSLVCYITHAGLFFERLLARPVPAPGGVRGVNRHARFAPQAIFSRLAGGGRFESVSIRG